MPALLIASAFLTCLKPETMYGDNVRCGGVNMRVVGIDARERNETCARSAPCPDLSADQARHALPQLLQRGLR